MSVSRKRTKRTSQVISTYTLRPRTRSSSIIPPNSSKTPSVQKKQTKKYKRNSLKKNVPKSNLSNFINFI